MMIKLDICKAYDNVNRYFLINILDKFGFCLDWCRWVLACIDSPSISVLVNGSPQGFFEMKRGIWQGDPLSPFLFIILTKVLEQSISKA